MRTVLLTGGTGYIGSHTCVDLIEAGFDTLLFDNLCNSSPVVIDRVEQLTGTRPRFVEVCRAIIHAGHQVTVKVDHR